MSILQNAIDSIQIGVEDFSSTDERRSVSAIRNIAAGMLLLFKEKLCRLSPDYDNELLIKKDIEPEAGADGGLVFKGRGKKTVDVFQIRERFQSMKVEVDWKRLDEITNLRNELEHYYAKKTPDAVREVVAKSFLLIRDFVVKELKENPQELFGNQCWEALLETNEVYSVEEDACKASIVKVDWKYSAVKDSLEYLRCPACNSALVKAMDEDDAFPDINLLCKSCSEEFCFNDVVEECVQELLSESAYRRVKDGEESPFGTCPSCDKETFVLAEGCCVACESGLDYTNCSACEEPLTLDEQANDGMCSYCHYKYEKLMNE